MKSLKSTAWTGCLITFAYLIVGTYGYDDWNYSNKKYSDTYTYYQSDYARVQGIAYLIVGGMAVASIVILLCVCCFCRSAFGKTTPGRVLDHNPGFNVPQTQPVVSSQPPYQPLSYSAV